MTTTANTPLPRDGVTATVTLNRPDRRNSLGDEMLTDLGAAFIELRDDRSIRVVIVTGAPPVFSAGGPPRSRQGPHRRGAAAPLRLAQEPVPPALRARQHHAGEPRTGHHRRDERSRGRGRLGARAGL